MTMSASKYLKTRARMCKKYVSTACKNCDLSSVKNGYNITCDYLEKQQPERAVEIVEKWSKEHPEKTYKSELLAAFPQCIIAIIIQENCPHEFFGESARSEECTGVYGKTKCTECWSREVSE